MAFLFYAYMQFENIRIISVKKAEEAFRELFG
jgi:uncharacterized DUF497 family protein